MDMKLIPIELFLYAKLTVDTFLFGKKTLLDIQLWHYSAPAEESNVFDIHTKDPDKSPPQFVEPTTSQVCLFVCLFVVFFWGGWVFFFVCVVACLERI